MNKLDLIKEVIDDWKNGKLSDGGALATIKIIIYPKYEPTRADTEHAPAISSGIAAALLRKSLEAGKSIKIPSLDIEITPPNAIACTCQAQSDTPGPWHETSCDMWSTVEGETE